MYIVDIQLGCVDAEQMPGIFNQSLGGILLWFWKPAVSYRVQSTLLSETAQLITVPNKGLGRLDHKVFRRNRGYLNPTPLQEDLVCNSQGSILYCIAFTLSSARFRLQYVGDRATYDYPRRKRPPESQNQPPLCTEPFSAAPVQHRSVC